MPRSPSIAGAVVTHDPENIVNVKQLCQFVSDTSCPILPIGNSSKTVVDTSQLDNIQLCSLKSLSGVTAYEPSEFLITARSGTPIAEVQATLAEHGQYLPFDPLWTEAKATVGGTVASGISGPCRMLYGSIRDFVMEVEFIDGLASAVRGGGKVVKNAAGFDFPKLLVGSLGRLGILTEVTFKVFPKPECWASCAVDFTCVGDCISHVQKLLGQPLPITGANICSDSGNRAARLLVRFAGPKNSMPQVLERAKRVLTRDGRCQHWKTMEQQDDTAAWRSELTWINKQEAPGLARIAIEPDHAAVLDRELQDAGITNVVFWCGGSVCWATVADEKPWMELRERASQHRWSALAGFQPAHRLSHFGANDWLEPANRIQRAIDPSHRFLPFQ
ncbi:MAG: FAD-binding protein [Planctomycetales bacterium]|nr:FAD-binding protein [Planctomycetales bacterium]